MVAAIALPVQAIESYEGYAYAPGTKKLLYRESHWIDGANRIVLYRCPGGQPFARKRVDSRVSATAPDFELTDARGGYREGVTTANGRREVFVQAKTGAPVRRKALTVGNPVIDAGFDTFVRKAWGQLDDKSGLDVAFVIPGRLGTLDFNVRRVAGDAAASRFRLSLDSWYGAVLPSIDVVYATTTRTLLLYRGISNLRGDDGSNLPVEIEFPADKRSTNVARSEADAATAARLVSRCPS